MSRQIITTFSASPKKLFLIDGLGALLSAFLLGVVLVRWEVIFGIPKSALYLLAALPCFFATYDFLYYFKVFKNYATGLKFIAVVNVLYCLLSIGLTIYHFRSITYLGWSYIIVEIIIVVTLSNLEFKTAKIINQ